MSPIRNIMYRPVGEAGQNRSNAMSEQTEYQKLATIIHEQKARIAELEAENERLRAEQQAQLDREAGTNAESYPHPWRKVVVHLGPNGQVHADAKQTRDGLFVINAIKGATR